MWTLHGWPYHVGGAVQMAVGGRARGHLAAVGCQGEVNDTAQSLTILILHSLSAGCHGYLSICPPIWRGWSLGRHPGKKKETGERKEKEWAMFKVWYNRLMTGVRWWWQECVWWFRWVKLVQLTSEFDPIQNSLREVISELLPVGTYQTYFQLTYFIFLPFPVLFLVYFCCRSEQNSHSSLQLFGRPSNTLWGLTVCLPLAATQHLHSPKRPRSLLQMEPACTCIVQEITMSWQ